MNRPERQRNHLLEKVSAKETRSHKKPGKRTKRWRKWITSHEAKTSTAIAAAAAAPAEASASA